MINLVLLRQSVLHIRTNEFNDLQIEKMILS